MCFTELQSHIQALLEYITSCLMYKKVNNKILLALNF